MVAVLYRVRQGMRSTWWPTVALALAVTVGAAAVLAVAGGATRTASAPDRYTDSLVTRHDAVITQSGGAPRTADIARLPSVEAARGLTFVFGGLVVGTASGGGDGADLDALVFGGTVDATADRIVSGRAPRPDQPSEFAASTGWVTAHRLGLGDDVPLITYSQAQADAQGFEAPEPEGPKVTARLVGITDGPGALDDPTPLAVFGASLLEEPGIGTAASVVTVDLRPGRSLDDLRADLDTMAGSDDMSVAPSEVVSSAVRTAVHAQSQSLWLVALVAFAVVLVTLGQLTARQVRLSSQERSSLATLGFTRWQTVAEMVAKAAGPILVGTIAGAIVAALASTAFPFGLARRIEPRPGLRVEWPVLAVGALVISVVLLGVVTAAVARSEHRAAAVPGRTRRRIGTAHLWPSASTGVRLALDRDASRGLAGGVVGLTFAVICLVGTLTFGSSLDRLVAEPARYGNNFDLVFGSGSDGIDPELVSKVTADPAVRAATLYPEDTLRVGTASLPLIGFERVRGDLTPPVIQGRLPAGDDEIALGRLASTQLGRVVGDTVEVRRADRSLRLRVVGIAALPNVGESDGVGLGGLVTLHALGHFAAEPTDGGDAPAQGIAAGLAPGATDNERAVVWRRITGTEVSPGVSPPAVLNLERIAAIPRILDGTLAVLTAFTIVQLVVVAVRRRRRDLAVLGALGAARRWRADAVRWQCIATIVAPLAVGAALGVVAGSGAFGLLADSIGAVGTATTSPWWVAAVLVGSIAIGIGGGAIASRTRSANPWLRVE